MTEKQMILSQRLSSWLAEDGDDCDVVISSRVRLARNIAGQPFPVYAQNAEIIERVSRVFPSGFLRMDMQDLTGLERALLVEKHLISPYLMSKSLQGAVLINEAEDVSIMINEEDHLRIQAMAAGLNLFKVLEGALEMDRKIEQEIPLAFDQQLGYLTSCMTNIGTGLRASVMVHLPGLVQTKRIRKMIEAIRSVGFVVRGMYGEGSRPASDIFQISNQLTLGKTEEEIVEDLTQVIEQLIMQERVARTSLKQKFHILLEDRLFRAYGLLKNSRVISAGESADAISDLRLGIELGYFEHIPREKMNELVLFSQPAFLRMAAEKDMSELEEKVIRASVIRTILGEE
ncbi:protein arginine kinase [Listeria costaricensis]|uniref:protein arginine kinase n=1 Tax=Listeria costaricensis TaxID=2026604 RepID=UPI001F09E98F|nr:protein arginine kinase [Listeria costaricensis]